MARASTTLSRVPARIAASARSTSSFHFARWPAWWITRTPARGGFPGRDARSSAARAASSRAWAPSPKAARRWRPPSRQASSAGKVKRSGANPDHSGPIAPSNEAAPNHGPGSRLGSPAGASRPESTDRSEVPSRTSAAVYAVAHRPSSGCAHAASGGADGARATSANAVATPGLAVWTNAMCAPCLPAGGRTAIPHLVSKHSETSDASDSHLSVAAATEREMTPGPSLVLRERRPKGTEVLIAPGLAVGGAAFVVMAGPCAVEDANQIAEAAAAVAGAGCPVLRGGASKPRTSPYSFQGLGAAGVRLLRDGAARQRLAVVTEILEAAAL